MRETDQVPSYSVPVVILTGTVGVGKTSVALEMSDILAARAVRHALIDLDALSYVFPRPSDDPYGQRMALENLEAVWRNYERFGAQRLILVRVVESETELDLYRAAITGADITVCRVLASAGQSAMRIRVREIGSGLAWHLRRSVELDALLDKAAVEDFSVRHDDRGIREVAQEVVHRLGW